ncbi:unnamed protein product [Cylicocyclus nassatus]|uniref:Uncharacterized protein n=1 Tax=Cylicocyclus nassatus TaxID=53992 RepID=A0AA36M1M4_CYLNA|nr:unnamed protein product [Cylicocyclus nassatus]
MLSREIIKAEKAGEVFNPDYLREAIQVKTPWIRNALTEFFGSFVMLFIGIGIVMQFVLSDEKLNTWIQINVGWGFAIAFTAYIGSKTSGGHYNPAVSWAMVTFGKLSVWEFLIYCVVQTLGAFMGSIAAFGIYYHQFLNFEGPEHKIVGEKATASCFCSFPAHYVGNLTCFFDQIGGTALLVLFVAAIIDRRNKIPESAHPFLFGCVLMMIGCAYGMNLGYPINPARDLGPRIFASFIYGSEVFTYHNYYFWIPIVAPFFDDDDEEESSVEEIPRAQRVMWHSAEK